MKYLAIVQFVLLLSVGAIAVISASDKPSEPSLADKINASCKEGYTVVNWAASDTFGYIPKGSVLVTCENRKTADVYQVAVQR